MKAFSIKKFHRMYWKENDEKIRVCIQLLRPETKEMCNNSLLTEDEIKDFTDIVVNNKNISKLVK